MNTGERSCICLLLCAQAGTVSLEGRPRQATARKNPYQRRCYQRCCCKRCLDSDIDPWTRAGALCNSRVKPPVDFLTNNPREALAMPTPTPTTHYLLFRAPTADGGLLVGVFTTNGKATDYAAKLVTRDGLRHDLLRIIPVLVDPEFHGASPDIVDNRAAPGA